MSACVAFAGEVGYEAMTLWTHTVLASARRIYAAHGFEIVDVHTHEDFGAPVQSETWRLDLRASGVRIGEPAMATLILDRVVVGVLVEGVEPRKAGLHGARPSVRGRVVFARRLINVRGIVRDIVSETVQMDPRAAGDQPLDVRAAGSETPQQRISQTGGGAAMMKSTNARSGAGR